MFDPSMITDTSTDQVHESLLQRLEDLILTKRQTLPPPTQAPVTTFNHSQQATETAPHPTIAQRLRIAQHEWSNLFSHSISQDSEPTETRPMTLTAENNRQNKPWGDQLIEKDIDVSRIYSLNVNGLSVDRRGGIFDDLC